MSRKFVILGISVCFFFAAASVIGEDSTLPKEDASTKNASTKNAPTKVDQHLLNDLSRIRQQMGGSVLSGSSLDADEGNSFQSDLKQLLERESEIVLPKQPTDAVLPTDRFARLVKKLREQSSTLDRIANEIEPTKQYDHADQLRDTADEMRKLARQFDEDSGRSAISKPAANPKAKTLGI